MKILNKIKALFRFRGEPAELEVSKAEIRKGKVFLHPVDDPMRIICIKSSAVDIVINSHADIQEKDVQIIDLAGNKEETIVEEKKPLEMKKKQKKMEEDDAPTVSSDMLERKPLSYFMPKKKIVSISLYEDEYDMLMDDINANGYQKTEYLLACVSAAKKKSLAATYRRYAEEHKERRTADRYAAHLAREQDYLLQQSRVRQENSISGS